MNIARLDSDRFNRAHEHLRTQTITEEADILQALSFLPVHGLASEAELLVNDRVEVKYVMPMEVLPYLLEALADEYSVLCVKDLPLSTYEVTYFDTPGLDSYLQHHNGHRPRSKYRFRRYTSTGTCFFELKRRNNKERTLKERFPWNDDQRPVINNYLEQELGRSVDDYQPSLYVNYQRCSFWNKENGDRLTVDFDLRYQRPSGDHAVRLPEVFILEVKRQERFNGSSFYRRAKSYGYFPTSFSKYCVGMCLTGDGSLKTNDFKSQLARVGRVEQIGVSNYER